MKCNFFLNFRYGLRQRLCFSVRNFLKSRNALLVHFSTPMTQHDFLFPGDLINAINLRDTALAFSTILASDKGAHPYHVNKLEKSNAGGCIGILVDISGNHCVHSVSFLDSGSYSDPNTKTRQSSGISPTLSNCKNSFEPIYVRGEASFNLGNGPENTIVEQLISLEHALEHFPKYRFFTANSGQFQEYSRSGGRWQEVGYSSIIQ